MFSDAMEDRIDDLEILGRTYPDGFTQSDAFAHYEWSYQTFNNTVRAFRHTYAEKPVNLISVPPIGQGQWTYKLVSTVDEARDWTNGQVRQMETRLRTSYSPMQSCVNAAPEGSIERHRAMIIVLHIGRAIEDLQMLREGNKLSGIA
jgi:hypothetical protein